MTGACVFGNAQREYYLLFTSRKGNILLFSRETGVLLHPTSLPGDGTLGPSADKFVRWMSDSGVTVWQILPLSPPVFGLSPYQGLSSFAINPALISIELLVEQGYLQSSDTGNILEKAALSALKMKPDGFCSFSSMEWVKNWSLFAAARERNNRRPWNMWPQGEKPDSDRLAVHSMVQFLAYQQWNRVRKLCALHGIRILGDLPIYTAHDSADVFFNRDIFKLDNRGNPSSVAGVPPDYFSRTGQLWGNPVYNWEASAASGHKWWISRMKQAMNLFDAVRIDHFRGFESYWEIPAGAATAATGKWVKGPGKPFFDKLSSELGALPVVAEDLGIITDEVTQLRKECGFPGMNVLHFSLQDDGFSLDQLSRSSVLYTGTHDNDTTAGWIKTKGASLGYSSVSSIIEMALASPAELTVIPMQDVLELDSRARMNTPATDRNNWKWRLDQVPEPVDLRRIVSGT